MRRSRAQSPASVASACPTFTPKAAFSGRSQTDMSTPNPVPNFEQNGAMLLTVAAINGFAKTDAAKLASALVAQSVASIF